MTTEQRPPQAPNVRTIPARDRSAVDSPDLVAPREQHAAELRNERSRARQAGQEYADELDLGIVPDPGAPMPHILANGDSVFVLFYVRHPVSAGFPEAVRATANRMLDRWQA